MQKRMEMRVVLVFALVFVGTARSVPSTSAVDHPRLRPAGRAPGSVVGSVVLAADGLAFVDGAVDGAVAHGVFVDSAFTRSNFGKLRISTLPGQPDALQAHAAGWLEGYLTAPRIFDHHHNMRHYFTHQLNASLAQPMEWLHQQEQWVAAQVAAHPDDRYWQVVDLTLAQFDGLVAGYQARAAVEPPGGDAVGVLSRDDLLFLNSNGDLYDVLDKFDAERAARFDSMDAHALLMAVALEGKCSALVKVTADLGDLLIGHSTWDSFTAMTRIYKHYELALANPAVVSRRLSFSSYPGELFSDDDLYITDAGLVVTETTNHLFNPSLLQFVTHEAVLSWQRVRVAHMLASSGSDWVAVFQRNNNGCYNNQYQIVDTKRFERHAPLQPGLLWVAEQLPGLVQAADMTGMLAMGHWASYNVAFFPEIYNSSGYPQFTERHRRRGPEFDQPTKWLTQQIAPRASIFRRDQSSVRGLEGMQATMRYNDWRNDPYSDGHPVASICGRGDLAVKDAVPKGCYDSKVTSWALARNMTARVVGGPTTSHGQPAFRWGDKWHAFQHRGMPDAAYEFEFETMSPADLPFDTRIGDDARAAAAMQAS